MSAQAVADIDRASIAAGVYPRPGAWPDAGVSPAADDALVGLLEALQRRGYRFVTPTPATHQRVVARAAKAEAASLEDVLGWSRPFRSGIVDDAVLAILEAAGVLVEDAAGVRRSTIRVSSVSGRLFVHSAYPTDTRHAVFLGPDSYRFAALIIAELLGEPLPCGASIVDIGCGAGVGGVVAAALCPGSPVTMIDVNPAALRFARINAAAAGTSASFVCGAGLQTIDGGIGLAIANPPFIIDDAGRAYRDGGGLYGTEVALVMARDAVRRLAPDGRLILYTGSAIIDGADPLADALAALAAGAGRTFRYREIDSDVFGEELDRPVYAEVDRIAIVAAIIGSSRA